MTRLALILLTCVMFGGGPAIHSDAAEPASAELSGMAVRQIALTTRNLPAAMTYYERTLGFPLLFETNGMAFFNAAGTRLMIAQDENRPDTPPTSIVYFEAEDFHAAVKRLIDAKVALDGPIETVQRTEAGELNIQQFHDPDGNALAIIGFVLK